ncbi:MAG: hypothetical protein DRK00_03350 [Thermoprotei archaeon]|nr:MAG: hypothetical protein DRK00_03350 [Thermoprotei archaeon]HDD33834.1 hypothetical protein [Thermofilaceae archaeon]
MPEHQTLEVRNPEEALNTLSKVLSSKQGGKRVRRGGCDLRRLDEEGSTYELVTTYIYKPGRFSKERSVVVVLPLKRSPDGIYKGDLNEAVFRILVDKKGSLEEEWSGNLKDAENKIPDIAKMYLEDINDLVEAIKGR